MANFSDDERAKLNTFKARVESAMMNFLVNGEAELYWDIADVAARDTFVAWAYRRLEDRQKAKELVNMTGTTGRFGPTGEVTRRVTDGS